MAENTENQDAQTDSETTGQLAPVSRKRALSDLSLIVLVVVAISLGLVLWLKTRLGPGAAGGGLEVGKTAPPLQAAGWLNGEAPTAADLEGKVVVVEAWASWCMPCWMEAEHLVDVHKQYQSQDVVFIGLTREDGEELNSVRNFIKKNEIPWRIGYGAGTTMDVFNPEALIPRVWVIGRDGKIVWNYGSPGEVEDGIEQALSH